VPRRRSFRLSPARGCFLGDDRVALIQQVKAANDIVDVVGGYVALRPAGPTFKGLCPFHDDKRPSFDVDPRRQRYRCWSCGKYGDVLTFVQEHERVNFLEALELLARRAGISLEKMAAAPQNSQRAAMLDVMRWAAEQFQRCLLDDAVAESARVYLGERRLTGETVRRFGLGYAPPSGQWLTERASHAGISTELLERVGIIAARSEGSGYYDRFRDRVMFPIRDARGHTVGFGGRILPTSAYASKAPKYYNSSDTPLFTKSDQLYGIDQARAATNNVGYLAVVEGYTDVLMAHQLGVTQVVATMGTALNARHVQQLKRFVGRVVLVFDADAGGDTGVDRALEVFVSQDVDLRVATLPAGLDPCDLLVQQGAEPFRQALNKAVDVLDFKLNRVAETEANIGTGTGIEGRRRTVDAVLKVIALAPSPPGHADTVKQELMVNRIAQRFALQDETVRSRLKELRAARAGSQREPRRYEETPAADEVRAAPASRLEIELVQVLLTEPALIPNAQGVVAPRDLEHPGLRLLLEGLYRLQAEGAPADLDQLRPRIDNPRLMAKALELQEQGRSTTDRTVWLESLLARFRERRALPEKQELQNQLHAANDHTEAVELLRQLQNRTV
jgi:DNA primase